MRDWSLRGPVDAAVFSGTTKDALDRFVIPVC